MCETNINSDIGRYASATTMNSIADLQISKSPIGPTKKSGEAL